MKKITKLFVSTAAGVAGGMTVGGIAGVITLKTGHELDQSTVNKLGWLTAAAVAATSATVYSVLPDEKKELNASITPDMAIDIANAILGKED